MVHIEFLISLKGVVLEQAENKTLEDYRSVLIPVAKPADPVGKYRYSIKECSAKFTGAPCRRIKYLNFQTPHHNNTSKLSYHT